MNEDIYTSFPDEEAQLRGYAKSKDLSVRLSKSTGLQSIRDLQAKKQVIKNLSLEEAYDFVDKYPW